MDIQIGETPAGRMKFELFSDIVPKYVSAQILQKRIADTPSKGQRKTFVSCALENIGSRCIDHRASHSGCDLLG